MTNNNLSLLAILVDHSGSMKQCREDMEGGLNTFIEEQAKVEGECEITLAEFDDSYDLVWPIQPITQVDKYELRPRGMTALLDGMGKFINTVGDELRKRSESQRPSKVIVMVVTDGLENASVEYSGEEGKRRIKELVEQQKSMWKWEFVFLGANMDAIAEGGSIGITKGASMTYNQGSGMAVRNMYAASAANVAAYRSGKLASVDFTDAQRDSALVDDDSKAGS